MYSLLAESYFRGALTFVAHPFWFAPACGHGWFWWLWVMVQRPFRNYFRHAIPADECVRVPVHYFRNFSPSRTRIAAGHSQLWP